MQKPESPPLLTHFRMGAHSTNYSVLNGNGTGGNAGGNGTAELRPQHRLTAKRVQLCGLGTDSCLEELRRGKARVCKNRTNMPDELMIKLGKMLFYPYFEISLLCILFSHHAFCTVLVIYLSQDLLPSKPGQNV